MAKPKQLMARIDAYLRNAAVSRGLATSASSMGEIMDALEKAPSPGPGVLEGTDLDAERKKNSEYQDPFAK